MNHYRLTVRLTGRSGSLHTRHRPMVLFLMLALLAGCGSTATPNAQSATRAADGPVASATDSPAASPAPTTRPAPTVAPTDVPATEAAEPTEEPTAEATEEPPFTCSDPAGCIEIAAGDPVRLAALLGITGPNEAFGVESQNGAQLAVTERGALLDHPVELVPFDDQCSPDGGQVAAQSIADDPTIAGVIGTSCTGAARSAIPLVTGAGLTMISPGNTAPELTAADRPEEYAGYLRTAPNDLMQGHIAAQFAFFNLGATAAATIHDGSNYAQSLQQAFADEFTRLGGTITNQETIEGSNASGALGLIAANNPGVIYIPLFPEEGAPVVGQARSQPGLESVALMSADAFFSPDFVSMAGAAAEGLYLSAPSLAGEAYETFLTHYEAQFGARPTSGGAAHAYDAANILLDAIADVARSSNGSLFIPRQAVRDAVFATANFPGITGILTCQPTGDCASGESLGIFRLENGEWIVQN